MLTIVHPIISAIVAMSENRVIGNENQLLWRMPADLKHFKNLTLGHPILMGRKTFQSIGKPLPDRINIVLTRDQNFQAPGCIVTSSLEDALLSATDSCNIITINQEHKKPPAAEIFIIGGAEIYALFMPYIQRIYLTIVHHLFHGDAHFPLLNEHEWKEVTRQNFEPDDKNPYPYSFLTLERNGN